MQRCSVSVQLLFFCIVAEQSHCLLHVKELKVTKTEPKKQIGD